MSEARLMEGDIVQQRSGGRRMIVNACAADGHVECVWHDRDGRSRKQSFNSAVLEKAVG